MKLETNNIHGFLQMQKPKRIGVVYLLFIIIAGCSNSNKIASPTPTDQQPVQEVKIPFTNNPDIRGTLFGTSDSAVILVHMGNLSNSQKDWADFARAAAQENFTVLTIDVPGFGKTPIGDKNPTFEDTVLASIDYLENLGFDKIVCIGASAGGNACLSIAEKLPLAGLGVISSAIPETEINYAALTMPKFFACTEGDSGGRFLRGQKEMYQNSPEPKELHIFQGDTHGTDILISYFHQELTDQLLAFLDSVP
jgi:pimeloyl-ACP methyl ester carboxylesterase